MPENQLNAVRGTVEQWRQAYEVRSVDALARLYSQDPELVVVVEGRATRGWPAVQSGLTERLSAAKDVRVRFNDVAVVPVGEAGASVFARMTREITDGVTTVTEDGVLTLALRRGDASWQIVSEHYSYLR
jgi:ketosteroid isomerase-like protein